MADLLRLLLNRPSAAAPKTVQRDHVTLDLADGGALEVLRVRDPRARRMRLSVDERGARLTLPSRASLASGERFLREHRAWLAGQVAAHAIDGLEPLARGHTATLPLRGAEVPLHWRPGRYATVAIDDDAAGIVFQHPPRAGDAALRRALRDFYEAEARTDVARWMSDLLPGLPRAPSRIRFKIMSSQWGSLAPDDALSLDLSLVLANPGAFEYVLVHELCHLLRRDHSPAFWREVELRFPAWRAQRAYFHGEGRRLKARLRMLVSAAAGASR